eukprot:Mycagemm_TRINITY_DN10370_c2_g6::TRINITY_DN10370_c2_g6_i1::g.1109::m.1109 type:complete len:140 gc:universal TRINITY_DN10370_c2_g6_i1:409-828(+)
MYRVSFIRDMEWPPRGAGGVPGTSSCCNTFNFVSKANKLASAHPPEKPPKMYIKWSTATAAACTSGGSWPTLSSIRSHSPVYGSSQMSFSSSVPVLPPMMYMPLACTNTPMWPKRAAGGGFEYLLLELRYCVRDTMILW